MAETATKAAPSPGGAMRLLRRLETVAYWLVIAPLAALLPASLAYRVACWRGDWKFRLRAEERAQIVRNLRRVLGDELGQEEAEAVAREYFRLDSCKVIDLMLLRGRGRALGKLVEIRGLEHLDAAIAEGKGAIVCSAHFGSDGSAFSLLSANGYPLTTIGRWAQKHVPMPSAERRFWDFVYARRLLRYRQRPMIEPEPGRIQVAVQAAIALRANEVVTISVDAWPLEADRDRAVKVPFLGWQATLLPGVVTLARLSGAPVLMVFMYRSADYRHQVLQISPPVPMDGDTATAFGRCVAAIDAAIRTSPAHWHYWVSLGELASIGVFPARTTGSAAVIPQPACGEPGEFLEDQRSASEH